MEKIVEQFGASAYDDDWYFIINKEFVDGINKWLSLGENPMHNLSVETTWEYISKNDIIFSAFCITKNKLDEAELSENVSKFEKDISKIQKILNSFYQLINLLRYYGSLNKIGEPFLIKFLEDKIIPYLFDKFYLDVPYLFEKFLPVSPIFF